MHWHMAAYIHLHEFIADKRIEKPVWNKKLTFYNVFDGKKDAGHPTFINYRFNYCAGIKIIVYNVK